MRDGQQSLWAYNMRTGMMVPVADQIDDAGFEAVELGGPVEMPKCVKELREDPWERYRLIIPKFKGRSSWRSDQRRVLIQRQEIAYKPPLEA